MGAYLVSCARGVLSLRNALRVYSLSMAAVAGTIRKTMMMWCATHRFLISHSFISLVVSLDAFTQRLPLSNRGAITAGGLGVLVVARHDIDRRRRNQDKLRREQEQREATKA